MPQKTPDGKVLLWDRTGKQFEQWPIDARLLLAATDGDGEQLYSTEPPEGVDAKLPPAPPRAVTIPRAVAARVFDGATDVAPAPQKPPKKAAAKAPPKEPDTPEGSG